MADLLMAVLVAAAHEVIAKYYADVPEGTSFKDRPPHIRAALQFVWDWTGPAPTGRES